MILFLSSLKQRLVFSRSSAQDLGGYLAYVCSYPAQWALKWPGTANKAMECFIHDSWVNPPLALYRLYSLF